MKILNLTDESGSNIKYKISKFPDGQQNIKILGIPAIFGGGLEVGFSFDFNKVQIKARLNNWFDLELIVATIASLRNLHIQHIELFVPYFLGARSDRKFEEGGNHYLKNVICPVINSLKLNKVTVLDPHSHVLEAFITNFAKVDNTNLVRFAFGMINMGKTIKKSIYENYILVSPDAGASHKIYKLAEKIGYKGDIITCSKERDTEGNLTKTNVPITGEQHIMLHTGPYKDFIIIDDICDGGRTFINIAKEIKEYFHESGKTESKIYLIVTHGIFSAGFKELSKYFDGIYCTNSYSTIGDYSGNDMEKTNVKQLNIF